MKQLKSSLTSVRVGVKEGIPNMGSVRVNSEITKAFVSKKEDKIVVSSRK